MPWWLASLAANAAIITIEYLNRTSVDGLGGTLSRTWWLIALAQSFLFFAYNGAPSLMVAWVVFTIGNSLMRLVMAGTILNEPLSYLWAGAGVAAMSVASYCIKQATSGG